MLICLFDVLIFAFFLPFNIIRFGKKKLAEKKKSLIYEITHEIATITACFKTSLIDSMLTLI